MKKNGFLEGAFIATVSVIACKLLGLIYVIPFYSIIGEQGGALYSYAYSIYSIFLSLATVGIPTAISKIVSEYNALDFQVIKQKAYKIGSKILISIGILFFLALFLFAPQIAQMIKGSADGGNSIESVTLVIRVIATAILIVPSLSIKRGYLQGHNFMSVPQFSAVIEQLVRVIIVVVGSYVAYKIFHLSLDQTVGIAVFGATVGALCSYVFVDLKIKKHKGEFHLDANIKEEEKKFTNKIIIKKIVYYALPLVLIDLAKSLYDVVDLFTVVRCLTDIGYDTQLAENVFGNITTWASKLNMIIISISIGLTASLIPNIMPSFVKKDFKDVENKVNKSLQLLIILVIPMTVGLSFLAYPVWNAFYGYNEIGINLFYVYPFIALTTCFQGVLVEISQIMNNTKLSFGSLFIGIFVKLIFNIILMYFLPNIGIESYYGPIISSILAQITTIIIVLISLNKKYKINYRETLKTLYKTSIAVVIMFIGLVLLKLVIPITNLNRLLSVLVCIIYALFGFIIYGLLVLKFKIIPNVSKIKDLKNAYKEMRK